MPRLNLKNMHEMSCDGEYVTAVIEIERLIGREPVFAGYFNPESGAGVVDTSYGEYLKAHILDGLKYGPWFEVNKNSVISVNKRRSVDEEDWYVGSQLVLLAYHSEDRYYSRVSGWRSLTEFEFLSLRDRLVQAQRLQPTLLSVDQETINQLVKLPKPANQKPIEKLIRNMIFRGIKTGVIDPFALVELCPQWQAMVWDYKNLSWFRDFLWRESVACDHEDGDCGCGFGLKVIDVLHQEAYWGYLPTRENIQVLIEAGLITKGNLPHFLRYREYGNVGMHVGYPSDAIPQEELAKFGIEIKDMNNEYWNPFPKTHVQVLAA